MGGVLEPWRLTEEVSSLLKWVFCGCSLLSVIELVQRQNLAPRRPVCVTMCDMSYLFCNLLTASILCWITATYMPTDGAQFSNGFVAVAAVWLTCSAILQRWKGLSASSFMCALHAIYFVAAVTDLLAFQQHLACSEKVWVYNRDGQALAAILVSSLGFAALGSFAFASCRSSAVFYRNRSKNKAVADEETFSPLGKLLGQAAFRPVLNAARRSRTTERDIRPLIRRLKCGSLFQRLYSPRTPKWTGQGARLRIVSSFCRILWAEALWVLLTGFTYFGTLVIRVPLLEGMIENIVRNEGKALTVLFISTCIAEFCLSGFLEYTARRLSIQLKLLMEAALFTKVTQMSTRSLSETPAGYLVSLVGIDCEKLNVAMVLLSRSLSGLMCLPIVLWMLSVRVGALPVAGCIAWQAVAMALFVPAIKLQTSLWKRIMKYRDERVRKLADTVSCVRLVKFYAWEDAVAQAVTVFRDREGFFIFLVNGFDGFVDSLQNSSSSLMTIIIFGTFASLNNSLTLTAAATFSALYMLSIIDVVIMNLAAVLRYNSMALEGLRRMTATLTAEEEMAKHHGRKDIRLKKGHVIVKNCSLHWSEQDTEQDAVNKDEKLALLNVDVDIPPGAFVGVVGTVGSGKSALLTGMLGELQCRGGALHVGGRVAYLPQTPCIFNMTIRDNILFGRQLEPLRYASVLEACELPRDLEMFPAGDLTEVGEKGETLSGGQKQRLALARAVYSDSDVYLMDDPLSGLDVHVGSKVYAQVIGPLGILGNKTRIVTCNQDAFLEHADQLLLVWKKHVVPFGSLSEVVADPRVPKTLLFGIKRQSSSTKHDKISSEIIAPDEDKVVGKLTTEEQRDANLGTLELLRSFATMSGVCLPLALLCSVARAVAVAVFLCWIKMWIDASSTMDNGGRSNSTWVTVLATLCLCDLVFGSLGGCLLALSFRRMSSRLHYAMLRSLLRCPISFFDTTPRGRVLNRFSADIDSVDCQLFMTSKEVFQTISVTMARLAVVGTQTALACGFGVVATCVYIVVVAITVRASNDLRFLENAWTSRVLQHLTETRDSMSSVRCYGAVKLVCRHFYRLVDGATRPFWATTACVRFARVSGGAAGLFAVLALVLTVGLSASPPSQSGVGLALSAAISIPMFLSNVNAALFFAFVAAISFERAVEYTRLPAEDDCTGISQTYKSTTGANGVCRQGPLKSWPTEGKVVFDSVTACYNEDGLSPALKDVSFVIQAREKVGVVGRTGAGKSSLILALLRVLKPSKGRIIIDGVDVACVSLRQLRSVVTVIPQEPYLMKGTLRDNLDATKCHSDQQVWEALRRAHMEDFVAKLPQGLLFDISEGAENLSAGQRQLLCLARALLRSPRVLLLDEATSRMDGDTDRMIQQTLRDGFSACTVITIAHRLHTILHCDRILVMSEGSVVEHGPVADLAVNRNSAFRAMAKAAGIDLATITTDQHLSPRL